MAVAGARKRVELSAEDGAELERIPRAANSEVRLVERARIAVCAAEGLTTAQIAERVGGGERTAKKWRARYARHGRNGSRRAALGPAADALPRGQGAPGHKGLHQPGADAGGRAAWPLDLPGAGEAVGLSASQAHLILQRAETKPHLSEHWIMSEFEERAAELCGLASTRPRTLPVVSIDEKTDVHAKAPVKPARPARREHGYERNGTQWLFAALKVHHRDVLTMPSRTRDRFDLIRFLDLLEAEIPVDEDQRWSAVILGTSERAKEGRQHSLRMVSWRRSSSRWSSVCRT
jgi:Homeodomain-like domain